MKVIDAVKFEKSLVKEYEFHRRVYNSTYAGKWTQGKDLMSAKVLETKIEILVTIIEALQESTIEGGY